MTVTPTTTVNYSDDEILQDSALVADDVACEDGTAAAAPRRKSADYGCGERRTYFAPYSRLDVEHHPLNGRRQDDQDDDEERRIDWRLATQRSYDDRPIDTSTRVDFPRTTTHDAPRDSDGISAAAAWPRDPVQRDDDGVAWWCGDRAQAVNSCRRRFIDERLGHYERRATTTAPTTSRLSTTYVRSISDQTEFLVRRHDAADLSSTASSSSSSSPSSRVLGRLAPQSSPPVAPTSQRPPPMSLRARKREQTARSAAAGALRRSNSVSGSSAARSLHSGDEGFADGRTRTPEPRRMSGSVGDTSCCMCRETDSHRTAGSRSNVSSTSSMPDQARKRSYRVGLNLFNKYVSHMASSHRRTRRGERQWGQFLPPPPKMGKNIFRTNVTKFGHFVNF